MKNLEKVLAEIVKEYKGYIDTVVKVEDAIKREFDWRIGSSEDEGMCTTYYEEVEGVAESEVVSWFYTIPTTKTEVFEELMQISNEGVKCVSKKLDFVEIVAYYEVMETNKEELLETKVKLKCLEVY